MDIKKKRSIKPGRLSWARAEGITEVYVLGNWVKYQLKGKETLASVLSTHEQM